MAANERAPREADGSAVRAARHPAVGDQLLLERQHSRHEPRRIAEALDLFRTVWIGHREGVSRRATQAVNFQIDVGRATREIPDHDRLPRLYRQLDGMAPVNRSTRRRTVPLFEPMNHLSRQLRRSFSILPVFLIVFGLAVSVSAQRRSISETDLFKFVWVADPQISPDGSQVAFVRVSVDEKKDQYDTSIWIAKADGSEPPRQLTAGLRDTSPRWSPDGRRLAFTRVVDKDGRPQPPQIYVMAMAGGEPRALTDIPRGAGNPTGRRTARRSRSRPARSRDD